MGRLRLAAGLAASLVFAACSSPEFGEPSETPPARPGNSVLRVAMTDPDSIDPMKASNRTAVLVVKQICDTLVSFDPATGALKPGIAESWTIAPDAKKVTFKLRSGVKFHNGRPLVAEDYVWSLSRFAHPKNGSKQHFFLERVVGYGDVVAEKTATLKGVTAPDPRTLEIELREPFAEFPTMLANPVAGAAIPKEEVEPSPEAFAAKPVCTGPYLLERPWSKGQDMVLVKWPGYYGANPAFSRGGAGTVSRIELRNVVNDEAGYQVLDEGEIDIAPVPSSRLTHARQINGRLASGVNGHVAYIGFPVTKAPFDNEDFRTALNLSINRDSIVADLLGGSRQFPDGFLPASSGPSGRRDSCEGGVTKKSDLEGAKQALESSGVDPAATNLSVYFNSPGGHDKWLEKVLEQWESGLGIQANLKPQEWPKYLDFLGQPGPDGPFRLAWAVKFPSPEALYDPLFASGSLDNFMRFSNPEFDGLLKKARATVDDQQRSGVYSEAGEVLCREMPIAPMWFGQNHVAFGKGVIGQGAGPPRLDIYGDPVLRELSSEK